MLKEQPLEIFLDRLASKASTPGGGSAAAVMGATGAALVSMVCNLTVGKKNYQAVETEMQALLDQAETLRRRLTDMIQADVAVFDQVMEAYGMPREDEDQKAQRSVAIQSALKEATEVPLACTEACAEVIRLSRTAAEKGNLNVVSDAGVAVMAAYAALKSAALNVHINISAINDEEFTRQRQNQLDAIMATAETDSAEIYALVESKL